MAKRRMFSTEFLQSDNYSDLPFSCQVLYINLMGSADDDGFISGPRRIMRGCNCTEEDLKYLVKAGFIFVFDSGIAVIRHWLIHNHIRKDRHAETVHAEEKAQLELKDGVYVWREDAEKKQNVCVEKVNSSLKNDIYKCRGDMKEKTIRSIEKNASEIKKDAHEYREETEEKSIRDVKRTRPYLKKDSFAWSENEEEKHIEPVEKAKLKPFCFPKEWEEIAECPQTEQTVIDDFSWQDQKLVSVDDQPAECYFEDPELNDLFTDFLCLRKELGCRDIPQLIQLLVIELSDYTTEQQKKILRDSLYHRRKNLYPCEITKQMAEDETFTPDQWLESLGDDPNNLDDPKESSDICNNNNWTSGFVSAGDILSENDFWA